MLKFIPLANLTVMIIELFLLLIPNSSIFFLFGFQKKKKKKKTYTHKSLKLLSCCLPMVFLNLIFWLSVIRAERSCCIKWCLWWLPEGKARICPLHPTQTHKKHEIHCLNMLSWLQMLGTIDNPLWGFFFKKKSLIVKSLIQIMQLSLGSFADKLCVLSYLNWTNFIL